MRSSRSIPTAPAVPRPGAVLSAATLSAALCLGAVACHAPAPAAGGAYGATSTATSAAPATSAYPATTAPAATTAKALLTVRKTSAGYVLATRTGQTIYWFGKDVKGSGNSACSGSCLAAWPAVTGAPAAAPGVQLAGKLGMITRPGGVVQATYNGYPLYTYAQDMAPGQATGNGAGGVWHVITGAVLSPSPATAAAASARDGGAASSPSATPSGSASGYGGGGY